MSVEEIRSCISIARERIDKSPDKIFHLKNEFEKKMPHLWHGFELSNVSTKVKEKVVGYINEEIDSELDIIKVRVVGMGADSCYHFSSHLPLENSLERYIVENDDIENFISPKSLIWKCNGNLLFREKLKKRPSELGLQDGDIISVAVRTTTSERTPLRQLHNGKRNKPKKTLKGKTKGSRKKTNVYMSPGDEMKKLKQQHSHAMDPVFKEAEER